MSAMGEASSFVLIGSAIGAGLGALGGAGQTPREILPGALAGASGAAGLITVLGLVGALFDAEAGLLTAGLGLGAAVVFGVGAGIAGYSMPSMSAPAGTQVSAGTTPASLPSGTSTA